MNLAGRWARELAAAFLALLLGFALMPLIIFAAGAALLGRYEGASANRVYDAVYEGLGAGSWASWGVVLGPYALYLVFLGLSRWWRAGADPD